MVYVFFLIGVLVHLIAKYRDANTEGKSFDWKRHIVLTLLGIPVGLLVIYVFVDAIDFPSAVFVGYSLDSIIKNLEGYKWKKIGNN